MNVIDTCFLCNGEFQYNLNDKEPFDKFEFKHCEKLHIYCEKCVGVLNRAYNMCGHKDIDLICPWCKYAKQKNNSLFK